MALLRKRPRSAMAPTLVFDQQGQFTMAAGSPGGSAIINYVAQTLIAMLDWHLDPQQAVSLPHYGSRNGPTECGARAPSGSAGASVGGARAIQLPLLKCQVGYRLSSKLRMAMQVEQTHVVRAQSRDIDMSALGLACKSRGNCLSSLWPGTRGRAGGDSPDATARLPHCGALQRG